MTDFLVTFIPIYSSGFQVFCFLAHLSTKCSGLAIVIGQSPVCLSICLFTITKKKKSSPKLTIRFQSNFTEMILRSCSFKILQRIELCKEQWLPWQQSKKTLKIFLSQTVRARAFIFGM